MWRVRQQQHLYNTISARFDFKQRYNLYNFKYIKIIQLKIYKIKIKTKYKKYINLNKFIFFVECSQTAPSAHATVSGSRVAETLTTYTCDRGYSFSDNTISREIVCFVNSTEYLLLAYWGKKFENDNTEFDQCQGIILYHNKKNMLSN